MKIKKQKKKLLLAVPWTMEKWLKQEKLWVVFATWGDKKGLKVSVNNKN